MRGWRYESARHSLAAKGIRTYAVFRTSPKGRRRIGDKYGSYTEYTEHDVGHADPHAAAYRKYDTEIVEMSPAEFLELTRKAQEESTGRSLSKEDFEKSVRGESARERRIHIARGIMQKRDVVPLPHYELDASGELRGHQEGRTRAVVAEMLDMEKIPVAKLTLRTEEQKRREAGEKEYSAKKVDLKRYAGLWRQESVKNEPWFQRGCKNVTARYTLNRDGTVKVVNTCDGRKVEGTATSVSKDNRKLKVDFGFPFKKGDYIIKSVNEGYTRAVVKSGDTEWTLVNA